MLTEEVITVMGKACWLLDISIIGESMDVWTEVHAPTCWKNKYTVNSAWM